MIHENDPRPGVGLRPDGLPDIVWCDVPAGVYPLGSDEDSDNPKHAVSIGAFKIARYPITYRQFQAFIDAADGFQNATWWDGLHELDKAQQRKGVDNQRFKFWNHPRENVSWYEAMAFCAWLSAKLGYTLRLPTEDEWEAAARGIDERTYPYGNSFDPTKGNTSETDIGQTSAVGIFPDGASPFGVQDMSGNVWEWMLTDYENPENADMSVAVRRVLRGGSWFNFSDYARAAYRSWSLPVDRSRFSGFRLVCFRP